MSTRINWEAVFDLIQDLGSLVDRQGNVIKEDPRFDELKQIVFYNKMDDQLRADYDEFSSGLHGQGKNVEVDIPTAYKLAKKEGFVDDATDSLFRDLLDDDELAEYEGLMESDPGYKRTGWNGRRYYDLAVKNKDMATKNEKRLLLAKLFSAVLDDGEKVPTMKPAGKRMMRGKLVDR